MSDKPEYLVLIDIETTGTHYVDDIPLEIGIAVVNHDLDILHENSWLIWDSWYAAEVERLRAEANGGNEEAKLVVEMHDKSGLFVDARANGQPLDVIEQRILDWLKKIDLPRNQPVLGSTIRFDRNFLFFNFYKVEKYFHYRSVDVSALKVVAQIWFPEIADGAKNLQPQKKHRVIPDLHDSLDEFAYYFLHLLTRGSDQDMWVAL